MRIFIAVWTLYRWFGTPLNRFYNKPTKTDARRRCGLEEHYVV
ncbi:hypothetical protein SAMN05877962_101202 [Alloalcanivorax xenomutans]|nr:hypothetical protein SAMN05877962_101202 [Alloalcanivorax xenomutans]